MLLANDLLDHYRLIRPIHASPSGEVWAAENYQQPHHPSIMIKVLASGLFSQPGFFTQADRWKSVNQHNIAPIVTASIYQNQQIVVSQYNPDHLLANWLARHNGRAPQEQIALDFIRGILTGLSYLHQRQLLHAELNPNNIQIIDDYPQLLNFGQVNARIPAVDSTPIINNFNNFDSLFYLAPEVFSAAPTVAADIWSTGVILYQLLTGQLPFTGRLRPTVIRNITSEGYTPLPSTIAPPLSAIIDRALQKDPMARFPSAQEMLEALSALATQSSTLNKLQPPPALSDFQQPLAAQLPAVYLSQARVYQQQQQWDQAIAACTQAISLDAKNSLAYQLRGDLYRAQKSPDAAIADYHQAILIDPLTPTTFIKRGNAYQDKGDITRALADYQQAITLAPTNIAAYLARGTVYYQQKQFSLALADYNQALKQDANCAAAYYNRGNIYVQQSQFDLAIADYTQALQYQPDARTYNNRGNVYYDKGLIDQAINDYQQALRYDATYLLAYYNRGVAYQTKGLSDLALADYNYILENLDATYSAAYLNRGDIYRTRGSESGNNDPTLLNQAINDYHQALAFEPRNAAAYHRRGLAYQAQNHLPEALADFDQAIKLDPQNAQFYHSRGNAHSIQPQLQLALTDYNQAIVLDPKFAHAYFNRGLVYQQLGQKREAILDFQQAKKLHQQPQLIADATEQLRQLGVGS